MTTIKTLATACGVTLALALIGVQSSVAQPGSEFENRGERQSEGFSGRTQQNPTSVSPSRQQAVETCTAQAQSESPGTSSEAQRQRGLL